ncbi:MAG: SMC family ATPase [bacterium]|nr:SMC family ATPase [bacterium]
MKLHKIRLENIRSYISEEIIFPEGKVLLWGNIGSGKSSILYAIDFVLFGLQQTDLAGASLLRNGTEEGSVELFFSIGDKEYVLKRVLKRTKIGVGQDAGYIIRNGIKEDKTAMELKQIVLELLNYPRDLITKKKNLIYRYTVYTPQEEMKTILLGPKEERLDTLRKVFGVDKYKRIKENTKIVISELKERKKIYEGASLDLPEKILEREKKEKENLELGQKYSALLPLFEQVELELKQKKEQILMLEMKKEELSHILKEFALCSLQITHIKEEKEGNAVKEQLLLKDIENLQLEKLELHEDVQKLVKAFEEQILLKEKELMEIELKKDWLSKINTDLALCGLQLTHILTDKEINAQKEQVLFKELESLELEKLELHQDVKELIKALDTQHLLKEKELRETLNKVQEFKTRKQHALHIKHKIESLNNCPTCFQEVSLSYKQKIVENSFLELGIFNNEIQISEVKQLALEEEIQNILRELEILKKREQDVALIKLKIQHLEKKKEELSLIQKKDIELQGSALVLRTRKIELEKQQESFAYLEALYSTLKQKLESLRKEIELLRNKERDIVFIQLKIQNLDKKKEELSLVQKRNIELQESLFSLEEQKFGLEQKQESLAYLEALYLPLKQEVDFIQEKIQVIQLEKTQLEVAQKHMQLFLNSIELEIHKKIVLREKKESLNKIQFWLTDHFIPLMENMEKNILFKVHAEFNALFEKWFSILIDNQTLSMCLDEEYSPKINQNGYDIAYEFLSGGEKTAGALAYRLALNQIINNLNVGLKTQDLLILDEPTDGFSHEQLDRLKVLIDELRIPQIIMVSHEAQIECFADHIIRFEKRDHVTKVIF